MDNFAEGGVEQQFYVADPNKRKALDRLVEEREEKRVGDRFKEDPNGKSYDGRSLWEQLEVNKAAKQAENDEKYKFRVYTGLDDEESEYLTELSRGNAREEEKRFTEDLEEVRRFRKRAALTNAERVAGQAHEVGGQQAAKRPRLASQPTKKGASQADLFAKAKLHVKQKANPPGDQAVASTSRGTGKATPPSGQHSEVDSRDAPKSSASRKALVLNYASSSEEDDD